MHSTAGASLRCSIFLEGPELSFVVMYRVGLSVFWSPSVKSACGYVSDSARVGAGYERRKVREAQEAEDRMGAANAVTHMDFLYT